MTIFDLYLDGEKQEVELTWDRIREERMSHLRQTDKYMMTDYPLTEEQSEELLQYRSTLRDLPETYDTPEEAAENYPPLPSFVVGEI